MKNRKQRIFKEAREIAFLVVGLLAFQTGLVQAYRVPTGSMEPTILPGDFVVADKITLGPRTPHWLGIPGTPVGVHVPALKLPGLRHVERGDIVIVETPVDRSTPLVKRVVAVGGDSVEIRDKKLIVNGARVEEIGRPIFRDSVCLPRGVVQRGIYDRLGNRDQFGPLRVPDGTVFLMGDNRDNSLDGRFFGPIPERDIIGRARFISLSFDFERDGLAPWEHVRWSRMGTALD
jgi:signal peptidase I